MGVINLRNGGVRLEPLRDRERVAAVAFHPQSESFEAPMGQKTVERAGNRTNRILQEPDPLGQRAILPYHQHPGDNMLAGGALHIGAIARAHQWWEDLCSGSVPNLHSLAQREGTYPAEITRMLRLVFLAPDIIARIVDGRQAADLNRQKMMRLKALPYAWDAQRKLLGM